VSGFPLVLNGEAIEALVVGGGAVAERRVAGLLEAGARVRVVAPAMIPALRALRVSAPKLELIERPFQPGDVGDALLVIAATDDRATNARVAADARRAKRLLNVVDEPESGNCVTPAVHRSGDVVVAVTTGGVPGAAARIRDAIAERFDARYAEATVALAALRRKLLERGDRDAWRRASDALLADGFCARVEGGQFPEEVRQWG